MKNPLDSVGQTATSKVRITKLEPMNGRNFTSSETTSFLHPKPADSGSSFLRRSSQSNTATSGSTPLSRITVTKPSSNNIPSPRPTRTGKVFTTLPVKANLSRTLSLPPSNNNNVTLKEKSNQTGSFKIPSPSPSRNVKSINSVSEAVSELLKSMLFFRQFLELSIIFFIFLQSSQIQPKLPIVTQPIKPVIFGPYQCGVAAHQAG